MISTFGLNKRFVVKFSKIPAPFGWKSGPNSVGEIVCARTYSRFLEERGANERWHEICERVVNGCYRMQEIHVRELNIAWDEEQAQRSAQEMFTRMFYMKFLPPGRGLWCMGTDVITKRRIHAALMNCFDGSEMFLTKEFGVVSFNETEGTVVNVSTQDGWKPALISKFGKQKVQKITFAPALPNSMRGGFRQARTNHRVEIVATPNHRWLLAGGTETTKLKEGDFVLTNRFSTKENSVDRSLGFKHGLIFADGNMCYAAQDHFSHQLRLCGSKRRFACLFENVTNPLSCNGDPVAQYKSNENLKQLPKNKTASYYSGFISGWLCGDSSRTEGGVDKLATQNQEAVVWIKNHAIAGGYIVTGVNVDSAQETNFGLRKNPCYRISLTTDKYTYFKVVKIEKLTEEVDVFCATVKDVGAFTLSSGIYTGNCAFVSTQNLDIDKHTPFCFLMDASMLGVGVGFDCKGVGKLKIKGVKGQTSTYRIPDSREGWVESVKRLILSYIEGLGPIEFIYSDIRKKGLLIKMFGGLSSGPEPLIELHKNIRKVLDKRKNQYLTSRDIVDIMNLIGVCVVAGNVRRTAEIAFGDPEDKVFAQLKNYNINPERQGYGWTSNNSINAVLGQDYTKYNEPICGNGEPGFAWLHNMRQFGRMGDPPNGRDHRVMGGNPCLEQSLEAYELCCLVETFINRHDSIEDYKRTLKFAYLYGKTVTLGKTHWLDSNRVMLRNRRIGCSISGVQQFIQRKGIADFKSWCHSGYAHIQRLDEIYSEWLCIPRSIKTTSIKPSGTVSLLTGSTPGMHWPVCNYHIRRVTLAKNSSMAGILADAGYVVEDAKFDASSVIVEMPVEPEVEVRDVNQVSMWEQLEMAAMLQAEWADNQVSCTVTFDPDTEGKDIAHALDVYQYRLKGVSFLPQKKIPLDSESNVKLVRSLEAYPQMPYSPITKSEYEKLATPLKRIDYTQLVSREGGSDRFCDGDKCLIGG